MVGLRARLRPALTQGREPPAHPVHGLILEPGERVRAHAPAVYSRLQRGPAADRGARAPIMAYNPTLMLGTMAVQALAERRRNRHDAQQAQPEWRMTRPASVITTTERIMCNRPDGGWLSFWYQDLTEHHIDLPRRTLVLAFHHQRCAPVRLEGPAHPPSPSGRRSRSTATPGKPTPTHRAPHTTRQPTTTSKNLLVAPASALRPTNGPNGTPPPTAPAPNNSAHRPPAAGNSDRERDDAADRTDGPWAPARSPDPTREQSSLESPSGTCGGHQRKGSQTGKATSGP